MKVPEPIFEKKLTTTHFILSVWITGCEQEHAKTSVCVYIWAAEWFQSDLQLGEVLFDLPHRCESFCLRSHLKVKDEQAVLQWKALSSSALCYRREKPCSGTAVYKYLSSISTQCCIIATLPLVAPAPTLQRFMLWNRVHVHLLCRVRSHSFTSRFHYLLSTYTSLM